MPLLDLPSHPALRTTLLVIALTPIALGCEPEIGHDSGTFDASSGGPGDGGLDTARNDSAILASDATTGTPAADSGGSTGDLDAGDAGQIVDASAGDASYDAGAFDGSPDASTGDAAASDASASDAAVSEASASDAALPDAAMRDGGPSTKWPGANASVTRFEQTGRTCHTLYAAATNTQRWNCQSELCGPARVQLELTALQGGAFDVQSCPSSDPNHYAYTTPYVLVLKRDDSMQVRVTFDSTLRDVPLTADSLRAKTVKGYVVYNGAHTTRPATASALWPDDAFDTPVEIVDYRDGLLHVKIELDHPLLSYADFRDHVCEGPILPIQTCTELYCNYAPGSGTGHEARHLEAHAIGTFTAQCPAQP